MGAGLYSFAGSSAVAIILDPLAWQSMVVPTECMYF